MRNFTEQPLKELAEEITRLEVQASELKMLLQLTNCETAKELYFKIIELQLNKAGENNV